MTSDVGQWMNGRGDSTAIDGGVRKKNRRDTLGKSVPEAFAISRGLDATDSKGIAFDDNLFEGDKVDGGGMGEQQLGGVAMDGDGMDQFMNLDDAGAGFYGDTLGQ